MEAFLQQLKDKLDLIGISHDGKYVMFLSRLPTTVNREESP